MVDYYARQSQGGKPLASAITETDYCLASAAEAASYSAQLQFRLRPMAQAILRLWRHPSRVLSRHTFDYGAPGNTCFYNAGQSSTASPAEFTPTADLYALLSPVARRQQQLPVSHACQPPAACLPASQPLAAAGADVDGGGNLVNLSLVLFNPDPQNSTLFQLAFASGPLGLLGLPASSTKVAISAAGLSAPEAAAWPPTAVLVPAGGAVRLDFFSFNSTLALADAARQDVVPTLDTPVMLNLTERLGETLTVTFNATNLQTDFTSARLLVGLKTNAQAGPKDAHGLSPPPMPAGLSVSACGSYQSLVVDADYMEMPLPCVPWTASQETLAVNLQVQTTPEACPILTFVALNLEYMPAVGTGEPA
jgi:hypothetical protein